MMISDLPRDMVEEVLCKLPMTSLRRARFTCKRWNNTLSKYWSFTRKYNGEAAKRKEFQVVMILEYKVYLMSVNLHNPSPSIEPIGKLHDAGVDIINVFHCQGLLLCVTKDGTRLVVWNPFTGQARWINPRDSYHRCDRYALGYEKKNNYPLKVLRFVDDYDRNLKRQHFYRGLSLKGNTYWFAENKLAPGEIGRVFLLCFNFTTESFGPRLRLPFRGRYGDTLTLSSVREEQLAVLFQECAPAYTLKVWISSKVGPNAVSWNKVFLSVVMKPLIGFQFHCFAGSFFVDEKNKAVVVIDTTRGHPFTIRNMAYVLGENGYFKSVDLGDFAPMKCWPLVCSYLPTLVKF
ncbi:F-box/kelch-repeat protein At3g16740-like isoform X2 [Brassica napus]|uniref:F-box/kelch-repeat protein At3g16740-like isoform X2 n=1 Tax=Brassica napus TaxID=3708 RepID=UPI0006AA87C8|nr:F-box/kelch-repeat protein At3g16740-like isoform X2 [Brassica napus]